MATLQSDVTCTLHPDRGAAAKCPSCGYFFCAECITEHEGRLTCASCLQGGRSASVSGPEPRRRVMLLLPLSLPVWAMVQILVAAVVVWLGFLFLADTLAGIPDAFHGGTLWR